MSTSVLASSMYARSMEYYPMMALNTKVVAAYVRISDPSREGESEIQSQKHGIREYCEAHGYILPEDYIYEEALSAYSLPYKKRPKLMELLAAAKRGEFKTVIVYKLSRVARTAGEMGLILGLFEIDYQVEVISVLDPLNQTKQEKSIGRALHGILSEMEHDNIVEATTRGKRDKVRLHNRLLGQGYPCFGFMWADKEKSKYAYSTEVYCTDVDGKMWSEYEVMYHVLHELLNGVPLTRIESILNDKQIPTRSGAKWHRSTLYNMVTNPAYAGIAIAFRWESVPGKSSRRLRNPEETFVLPEGTIPPFITQAEREQIMRQFELNKQSSERNAKFPEVGIMRGRVRCGICGLACYISQPTFDGKRSFSYQCKPRNYVEDHTHPTVRVALVDAAAWELAVTHIKNPQVIEKKVEEILCTQLEQDHIDRLNAQLITIVNQLKKLMEFALEATDVDMLTMARERRQQLEKEKRDIERLLLVNLQDKEKEEHVINELGKFVAWCDSIRPFLDDPDYEISVRERRQALAILGITATIFPYNHDPRYSIDVGPTYIMQALIDSGYHATMTDEALLQPS